MKNFLNSVSDNETKLHQDRLKYCGLTDITDCFSNNIKDALKKEAFELFQKRSRRKDISSEHTNTPCNMNTVNELDIEHNSKVIKQFYYSKDLVQLLANLSMEKIDFLPWMGERFVINGLINDKDTQGWHWDDCAYALVFIADCPPENAGGLVECVANTHWIESSNIQRIVKTHPVQSWYFKPGSFYFMKSDTTLHRVTSIDKNNQRLSIEMSYCNQVNSAAQICHNNTINVQSRENKSNG